MAELTLTITIGKDVVRGGYVVNAKSKHLKLVGKVHDSLTLEDEKSFMRTPYRIDEDYVGDDGILDEGTRGEIATHIGLFLMDVFENLDVTSPDIEAIKQGMVEAFSVQLNTDWTRDILEK